MNLKLSIIVPIYGVEQYLRKCVDSLLNQDMPLSDYEIILVDDESPDACPQICDCYAAGHENIRVIHRKNGGLSAARNSGIEVAQGEYIMFVDSDDYIEPNVLGTLLEQVESEQLDVLRYDYRNVRLRSERVNETIVRENSRKELTNEQEYEVFQPYKQPHKVDKKEDVVDGVTYLNERMGCECYAVMFIIKQSLLIDYRCLFTEGIHFEDVDWLPRMMVKAKRVASADTIVYNYLIRQGSITQVQGSPEKTRRNVEDFMYLIDKYNSYMKQEPNCSWLKNMQSSIVSGVLATIAREFYEERKEYIKRLKEMNVFPLSIADQGKTYMRRARLTNLLGADVYCVLMHAMYR